MESVERRLGRIAFIKNDFGDCDLARANPYKGFLLRLTGTLTVGTANATAVVPFSPLSLIKKVLLTLNGEHAIKSYSGKLSYIQDRLDEAVAPEKVAPGLTVGVQTFSGCLKVNFELPAYPEDRKLISRLHSGLLTGLVLQILFGQESDLVTPDATTTLAISGCQVEIISFEYVDLDAQRVYSIFQETTKRQMVTGADSDLRVKITSQNQIVSILLNSVNNSLDNDSLVTKVSAVVNGTEFKKVLSWQVLKEQTAKHYGIVPETGIVSLVFDKDKDLNNLLRLAGTGIFEIVFEVIAPTGTAYIDMLVREIVAYAG